MEIQRNVPMPERGLSGKYRPHRRYPFRGMNVGDSFFVEAEPGEDLEIVRGRVLSAFRQFRAYAKRPDYRVISRKEEGGIRIWRSN